MRPSSSSPAPAEPPAGPGSERRRDPADRRAGFSLVEVLAAVVLTVALVVAILPFFAGVVGRWMTGQRLIEDADLWMRAGLRLAGDTARAVPVMRPGPGEPRLLYAGDERNLLFVRPALSAGAGAAYEIVGLAIERSDDGEAVVRRSAPFDPAAPAPDPGRLGGATTLLSGPWRFRFEHVSARGDRTPAWTTPGELPRLVELVAEPTARRPAPPAPLALPFTAVRPPAGAIPAPVAAGAAGARQPGAQPPPGLIPPVRPPGGAAPGAPFGAGIR